MIIRQLKCFVYFDFQKFFISFCRKIGRFFREILLFQRWIPTCQRKAQGNEKIKISNFNFTRDWLLKTIKVSYSKNNQV